jgi:hypothetical protein
VRTGLSLDEADEGFQIQRQIPFRSDASDIAHPTGEFPIYWTAMLQDIISRDGHFEPIA